MNKLLGGLGVKVYGIGFLALCVLFVWLTYAAFTKQFADYDEVTLKSSKTGLSLPTRADVKIRGVIVGEVLQVDSSGDGAELTLGLYPDQRETVPANTTAMILPKTLFGEKYVALQVPADPQGPIEPGATIEQSDVAIEVEEVLNDLFPLLRTIKPAELNYTLTAIANALEGRGNTLGEGIETFDAYLKRQNPEMPALLDSIDKLGQVSSLYNSIIPDLSRLLRNSVTTTGTLESKEEQLQALFTDVAGFSDTTKAFLRRNGDNMIRLAEQGQRILPMLARYAPEYNCLFRGIVGAIPGQEEAFRDKTLHIILEVLPEQRRGYEVRDLPRYADNRGAFPYCNLMYKSMRDGFNQNNLPPETLVPRIRDGVDYPLRASQPRAAVNDLVAGTAQERLMVNAIASPVLQVHVDDVPDVTTLLLGPLTRGTEVDLR
jgi:phospholipid/cholesterol/gamma-HCH transport system substrate-binding protein